MQTRNTNLGKSASDVSFSNVTFLYKYLFRVKFGLYKMEKKQTNQKQSQRWCLYIDMVPVAAEDYMNFGYHMYYNNWNSITSTPTPILIPASFVGFYRDRAASRLYI